MIKMTKDCFIEYFILFSFEHVKNMTRKLKTKSKHSETYMCYAVYCTLVNFLYWSIFQTETWEKHLYCGNFYQIYIFIYNFNIKSKFHWFSFLSVVGALKVISRYFTIFENGAWKFWNTSNRIFRIEIEYRDS